VLFRSETTEPSGRNSDNGTNQFAARSSSKTSSSPGWPLVVVLLALLGAALLGGRQAWSRRGADRAP
jgi:hypothetical protein